MNPSSYSGLRHPHHTGSFVREKGGWGKYHKWCVENGFMKMSCDSEGNLFPMFILQPRKAEKQQGRNEPCACDSGKKFKKCLLAGWYKN